MSVATLPSDDAVQEPAPRSSPVRAEGRVELRFARRGAATRLSHLYQRDPCRVLFPNVQAGEPPLGVIVTTSGGVVGGDSLTYSIHAGRRTNCTVTTQAAEKIYRSDGAASTIDVRLRAGADAACEWVPQETILFDRARLRRATTVDLGPRARLIAGEMVVFGRAAHGERVLDGLLHDSWRVRRSGRLVWADALALDGDIGEIMGHPASFGGAAAVATMIYCGEDAPARVYAVRAALSAVASGCRAGASCIGDVLVTRLLGADIVAVREAFAGLWARLRSEAMGRAPRTPRLWNM
ncbi:MAG: urease accessory protein UreD [Alphaproteobacteria bacterium]|nr:urease accessory protein UreD [Alphaproteobacteria bacterium]